MDETRHFEVMDIEVEGLLEKCQEQRLSDSDEEMQIVRIRPESNKIRQVKALILVCGFLMASVGIIVPVGHAEGGAFPGLLTCPATYQEVSDEARMYNEDDKQISNIDDYIKTFRSKPFDEWDVSYENFKEKLQRYKAEKFASLKSGDIVYESACGIGLNLVATLEVLEEQHNITDLVVYGNDFAQNSVELANKLMDGGILPANGHKGAICQSDSKNLSFVPKDSFDLVFTGYLTNVWDPLETGLDEEDMWDYYSNVCLGEEPNSKQLLELWTSRQEEWYTQWVGEMVRIAKPGSPVIIEQISQPYCDNPRDWDGMNRTFWENGIQDGIWDVDPSSLEMVTAEIDNSRYNVYMRKNK